MSSILIHMTYFLFILYECLPSHVPPFSSLIKSLRNKVKDDNLETTDTSVTDKDDTSHSGPG